jgi:hypothetical protein
MNRATGKRGALRGRKEDNGTEEIKERTDYGVHSKLWRKVRYVGEIGELVPPLKQRMWPRRATLVAGAANVYTAQVAIAKGRRAFFRATAKGGSSCV